MAQINSPKKINPSDFKDAPSWFTGRFLDTLNKFIDTVYNALSNSLTFAQNFNAFYYFAAVAGAASAAGSAFNFSIPASFSGNPTEVAVVQCTIAGAPETVIGGNVGISWYASAGVVNVKEVFGLTAGVKYTLVLRIT